MTQTIAVLLEISRFHKNVVGLWVYSYIHGPCSTATLQLLRNASLKVLTTSSAIAYEACRCNMNAHVAIIASRCFG